MTPLERVRIARNLKKSQAARMCGIDRSHYGRIEAGTATPSFELAETIAKVFGHEITVTQIARPERYASLNPEEAA